MKNKKIFKKVKFKISCCYGADSEKNEARLLKSMKINKSEYKTHMFYQNANLYESIKEIIDESSDDTSSSDE